MTPAERSRVQQAFNDAAGRCSLPTPRRRDSIFITGAAWSFTTSCRGIPSRLEQRAGRVDRLGSDPPGPRAGARRRAHGRTPRRRAARHPARGQRRRQRGRMLDALTESRVAAAVMTEHGSGARRSSSGGAATPSCAVPPPEDLGFRRSAGGGATRTPQTPRRTVVHWPRGRGGTGEPSRRRIRRRTRLPPGLYLVFALTLMGADGSPLHAEARLVRVEPRAWIVTSGVPRHSARTSRGSCTSGLRSIVHRARGRHARRSMAQDSKHCAASGSGNGRRRSPTCSLLASRPRPGCWCKRACSIAGSLRAAAAARGGSRSGASGRDERARGGTQRQFASRAPHRGSSPLLLVPDRR